MAHFNPRSREGSDSIDLAHPTTWRAFQSTLPRGERRCFLCSALNVVIISIHAPARGATCGCCGAPIAHETISIHAPARGATRRADYLYSNYYNISIHAPARGATSRRRSPCWRGNNLNPRSREGSDARRKSKAVQSHISIHAPARGATYQGAVSALEAMIFQSTLPRGERPRPGPRACRLSHFNPRSREGSDLEISIWVNSASISIHAPARGATRATSEQPRWYTFQSTLPRGERPYRFPCCDTRDQHFNPRSREGSDAFQAEPCENNS